VVADWPVVKQAKELAIHQLKFYEDMMAQKKNAS